MSRAPDFRVDTQFFENLKARKLMAALGDKGVVGLWRLWAYAAKFRPSGAFDGMSNSDIEIAIEWKGKRDSLIATLVELKFLEHENGVYRIHDWEEHNGYAMYAPQRSEQARQASRARWQKSRNSGPHTTNSRDYKMS